MDLPLDHNFPERILESLREFITEANLIPLRRIDERLPDLDDRQLVIALHQLGFAGFVTSNYKMLQNPVSLLRWSRQTFVYSLSRVSGMTPSERLERSSWICLLMYAQRMRGGEESSGFGRAPLSRKDPTDIFNRIAQRRNENPKELYDQVRVTDTELMVTIP